MILGEGEIHPFSLHFLLSLVPHALLTLGWSWFWKSMGRCSYSNSPVLQSTKAVVQNPCSPTGNSPETMGVVREQLGDWSGNEKLADAQNLVTAFLSLIPGPQACNPTSATELSGRGSNRNQRELAKSPTSSPKQRLLSLEKKERAVGAKPPAHSVPLPFWTRLGGEGSGQVLISARGTLSQVRTFRLLSGRCSSERDIFSLTEIQWLLVHFY